VISHHSDIRVRQSRPEDGPQSDERMNHLPDRSTIEGVLSPHDRAVQVVGWMQTASNE
jgi:hypothetical protein